MIIKSLQSYVVRHALGAGLAVFLAVFVNRYYGFSHECWIVLTAYLVSQTTRGTPLRQGMIRFFCVLSAMLLSTLFVYYMNLQNIRYVVISILFVLGAQVAFLVRQRDEISYNVLIYFIIVCVITTLAPDQVSLYDRLLDIFIGAVIGLVCVQLILPVRLEQEFRDGVASVLQSFSAYSKQLSSQLSSSDHTAAVIKTGDLSLFWKQQNHYPEWVYEIGFNPGLRSGFRFFLVNLDRIAEILLSLGYLIRQGEPDLLREISVSMSDTMNNNEELLNILLTYFTKGKLEETSSDYTGDITALEQALQRSVPDSIELLDIQPGYINVTAIVRDVKDLRAILLQLIIALPSTQLMPLKSS
jgi:hypothetical protein